MKRMVKDKERKDKVESAGLKVQSLKQEVIESKKFKVSLLESLNFEL